MKDLDTLYLRQAIEIARRARLHGNHPFGALLVGKQGNQLLEAENTVVTGRDCTAHAELNLVRQASAHFERSFLEECTLYTSTEPCAMCSGAIYWSGIGRVVYALSEAGLLQIVRLTSSEPFLYLPSREVFTRGGRPIEVSGPALEDLAAEVHRDFWR